jgi:hypothetical protein
MRERDEWVWETLGEHTTVCMITCGTRVYSSDWIYSNFAVHLIIYSCFDVLANTQLAKINCVLLALCFIFLCKYCLKHFLLWWEFSKMHMIYAGGICKNTSKCYNWSEILKCTGVCQQILAKFSNMKFHGNTFRNSWICTCRCMDRQTNPPNGYVQLLSPKKH